METVKPKRWLEVAGIVLGALLAMSPLAGAIGTVISMVGAFSTLSQQGISDPRALSSEIGHTMLWTTLGITLCPVGIILLTISIVFLVRPRPALPPPLP